MFEKPRSKKAFDNCQVRALVKKPVGVLPGSMVCAKYPAGFEMDTGEMRYDDDRASLALSLGCLACPYRKAELQTGESAVEAIKRLGSQDSIDQLNRLFQESDAAEPPQPPDSATD